MPDKQKNGKRYKVNGKTFTWTTEDGAEVTIPMRVKLKVIRGMAGKELDPAVMFDILAAIAPGQEDAMDEMDIATDFQPMFTTWQEEYQKLSGASLGE